MTSPATKTSDRAWRKQLNLLIEQDYTIHPSTAILTSASTPPGTTTVYISGQGDEDESGIVGAIAANHPHNHYSNPI